MAKQNQIGIYPIGATLATLIDTQSFTANGTWTKPSGASYYNVLLIGSGGGGGGSASLNGLVNGQNGGAGGNGGNAVVVVYAYA